jgi:hypothetical protein
VIRCDSGTHPWEASEQVVAMLGSRASVAATFGGVGFHERGARRKIEQAVTRSKMEVKQEKMGKISDPLFLFNGCQGQGLKKDGL